MQIMVNNNRLLSGIVPGKPLAEVIDHLCLREHDKGKVVTSVRVNDAPYEPKNTVFSDDVRVTIESANPFDLASESYEVALTVHEEILKSIQYIVLALQNGERRKAATAQISLFENLSLFADLALKPIDLLAIEPEAFLVDGQTLESLIHALFEAIRAFEKELKQTPALALADWIECQFLPIVSHWQYVLNFIITHCRALNYRHVPRKKVWSLKARPDSEVE